MRRPWVNLLWFAVVSFKLSPTWNLFHAMDRCYSWFNAEKVDIILDIRILSPVMPI